MRGADPDGGSRAASDLHSFVRRPKREGFVIVARLEHKVSTWTQSQVVEVFEQPPVPLEDAGNHNVLAGFDFIGRLPPHALAVFDPVWESLSPREQSRIVRLLVERVGYGGREGRVTVTFRSPGVKALCSEADIRNREVSA